MQPFYLPFKQAQHFQIFQFFFFPCQLMIKGGLCDAVVFLFLFQAADSKCEFQAAFLLLKPRDSKV